MHELPFKIKWEFTIENRFSALENRNVGNRIIGIREKIRVIAHEQKWNSGDFTFYVNNQNSLEHHAIIATIVVRTRYASQATLLRLQLSTDEFQ